MKIISKDLKSVLKSGRSLDNFSRNFRITRRAVVGRIVIGDLELLGEVS